MKLWLPSIILLISVFSSCAKTSEQAVIQWGKNARSQVLDRDELGRLKVVLPSWKTKQMLWPSAEEISSKSVAVNEKLRVSCVEWLGKFMKRDYLPKGLTKHLVAMKNWGLIMNESKQERLCDVFVARFRKAPYVIHMQEGACNVVITVADERYGTKPRVDHKNFVIAVATQALNSALKPDPGSENLHVARLGGHAGLVTRVSWKIEGLSSIGKDGKKYIDARKAAQIGTTSVEAETDGRFVRFEIWKERNAKSSCPDPYVERFKAKKSESGPPEGKGK